MMDNQDDEDCRRGIYVFFCVRDSGWEILVEEGERIGHVRRKAHNIIFVIVGFWNVCVISS